MLSNAEIDSFRRELLTWFSIHKRDLPWRRTKDPYAIWISEVMLQQTRVAAATPYYERFLQRFPNFIALAQASEGDLLAHWAGLGYYYRARNLQKAAQKMAEAGVFPTAHPTILALPGIGEYTAAAVASIAFDQPHAVVDGNVYRVLSRVLADSTNIAGSNARKHFAPLAQVLLDPVSPGDYNQALMELGATVCLPRNPQCLVCPVANLCRARQTGRQNEFPVKTKGKKTAEEIRVLFWAERNESLLLWQRPAHSRLMPGFWELPEREQLPTAEPSSVLAEFSHGITFHNYRFQVAKVSVPVDLGLCKWLNERELASLPLSTIARKARIQVARRKAAAGTGQSFAASS